MTRITETFDPALQAYLVAHGSPPDPVLRDLAAETARLFPSEAGMQIGPEQGTFMTLLARLAGARRAVEVGTFTGYSSICLARGLAEGGTLLACDTSEEWTAVARRYWERAGIGAMVDLRIGPALETIRALPDDTVFDLVFLDADKEGYIDYWEALLPRLAPGGLVLVDNTLMYGRVKDPDDPNSSVQGVRAFNDHALADTRVELVLLPVGDGLTLARKL